MQDGTFIEFIKWGISPVIAALVAARAKSENLEWDRIRHDIASAPEKLGDWSVLPA